MVRRAGPCAAPVAPSDAKSSLPFVLVRYVRNRGTMISRRKQSRIPGHCARAAVVLMVLVTSLLAVGLADAARAAAPALENIRVRGHVLCGVGERLGGLSRVDASGTWSGIEVEFCGALAAAVFGDRSRVRFRSVNLSDRFRALTTGEIDVLLRGTALTFSRESELGVRFAGVLLHDGQGFLVKRALAVSSVLELSGANICVQSGTSAGQGLEDYFGARQMRYRVVANDTWDGVVKSYVTDECNLLTGDASQLAIERSQLPDPSGHILLPELITQEQLGPMVRQGDDA